jgi:hypothetical protein
MSDRKYIDNIGMFSGTLLERSYWGISVSTGGVNHDYHTSLHQTKDARLDSKHDGFPKCSDEMGWHVLV